ncbi:MAG: NAD-dependent epimerase/dehydratase family protein [Pirellulaceae bacterium]|nr:NAD-dependent epimerase/dehydratase family protein [Pirellulaceae bacterium]
MINTESLGDFRYGNDCFLNMPKHFIFGCGFLGRRLAERLIGDGDEVWTSTRSHTKSQELETERIHAIVADPHQWSTQELQDSLPAFDAITICIGNDRRDGQEHSDVYQAATNAALNLARRFPNQRCQIQFVSTTGVYKRTNEIATRTDADPASDSSLVPTIAENAPLGAERPGARASIACEKILAEQSRTSYGIFRLAGIYSRERIPNLAALRSGQPMKGSGDSLLNLIHVDDAAAILAFGSTQPPPWSIINVSDGNPVRRREFYEFLAQRYECPSPQFTEEGGRSSPDKYINTQRLTSWFPGPWKSPNYRVGLVGET